MRVVFAVYPAPAHFLPMVPYALALQAAGHQVVVAAPASRDNGFTVGDVHAMVQAAGLTSVACGDPEPLSVQEGGYPDLGALLPNETEYARYVEALDLAAPEVNSWDLFYCYLLLAARNYLPPQPRQDMLALVDFTRRWQPDLVLWDPWLPGAAVAARAAGAAHARVLNAPDVSGWAIGRFEAAGLLGEDPLSRTLHGLAERVGVTVDRELLLGQWTVDPFPSGLRLPAPVTGLPVSCVPYNGSGALEPWLQTAPERPRVALTLGVSARRFLHGDWGRTAALLAALAELDVEVVATLNAHQLEEVPGGVPDNVVVRDYVPLTQLLPTCSAVVNHGSIGTFLAAICFGVPQVVCDTDESIAFFGTAVDGGVEWKGGCEKQVVATETARVVTDFHAGIRVDHRLHTVPELREGIRAVLGDPAYRAGAQELRRDSIARPSPAAIVPTLETLTAARRG